MAISYHQGRLIDHVHLRVTDVEKSRAFYRAVLEALGRLDAYGEGEGFFYADELYVDGTTEGPSKVHLAFQARSAEEVERFHRAGIAAGGTDNGAPGPRNYHPTYYAAFVLDPDGNNIEAVYHGPTERSAESLFIRRS
ncbi:MAG TPA: VOC family protein [Burkholderiales bacterium]|nr:VOC family protein [Burkholderiales bacterium]